MSSNRYNAASTFKPVLPLCLLMLVVVSGASFLTYRQGAQALREKVEEHMLHQVSSVKASTEQAIATLIEDMESWAAQPVMVRILDGDADNEIADLLDNIAERLEVVQGLACVTAAGEVLASTDAARMKTSLPAEALEEIRGGRRAAIKAVGEKVVVTVPIFWQFDEREFLGVLQATVMPEAFLVGAPDWWAGLASPSGVVIEHRGPALPPQLDLDSAEEMYPDVGRVVKRTALVAFPTGVTGPEWYVVVADKHDTLFSQIDVLKKMAILMAAGAWGVIVLLVIGYTRRQRVLMGRLAEHARELEEMTAALRRENIVRKRAEEELRRSAERFRQMLEALPVAIRVVQKGVVVFCNSADATLFGYEGPEEIIGTEAFSYMVEGDVARLRDYAERRAAGDPTVPTRYEARAKRQDGSILPVELVATRIIYGGEPASLTALYDLSERKRLQLYESILPVCCVCGKVRDDTGTERGKGSWESLQAFVMDHSDTSLSHTFCPPCYQEYRQQQGLPPEEP